MEMHSITQDAEKVNEQVNHQGRTPEMESPDAKDLDFYENTQSSPQQEEETMMKKYGTLVPRKLPLIAKDHEHAFFDSADWALGKKSKGPLEALRPKLQPSPHLQVRSRSAYAPTGEDEDGRNDDPKEKKDDTSDGIAERMNHSAAENKCQ